MNRRTLLGAAAATVVVAAVPSAGHGLVSAAPNRFAFLTSREWQAALLMAQGWTDKEIARVIGLSRRTLDVHIQAILVNLEVPTRAAAIQVFCGRLARVPR